MTLGRTAAVVAVGLALCAVQPTGAADDRYQFVVETYALSPTAAVNDVRALSDGEIGTALDAIEHAERTTRRWAEDDLKRAALLHAQAAINCFEAHAACGEPQLGFGVRMARLAADRGDSWFALRWFRGTARVLRHLNESAVARTLDEEIRKRPDVEMARQVDNGLREEQRGNQVYASPRSITLQIDSPIFMPTAFNVASDSYRAALKQNPRLMVAAVHAGRLAMLRGDDTAARAAFERAIGARERATRYLAHMFLGAMDERAEQPSSASLHYVAAIATYPRALSARLALATLRARGGGPSAPGLLDAALEGPDAERAFDPWWTYIAAPEPDADPSFELAILRVELIG